MRHRLVIVVAVLLFLLPKNSAAQDPRGIFNFMQQQLQQQIERQQQRDLQRQQELQNQLLQQEYERARQEQRAREEAREQARREEQQQLEREQELARERQRELERRQAEAERARQEEERRLSALRALNAALDGCRRYVIASCEIALESPVATAQDRADISNRLAIARKFEIDRGNCQAGSVPSCKAASAFPALADEDRNKISQWQATAERFDANSKACETGSINACDQALAASLAKDTQRVVDLTSWRARAVKLHADRDSCKSGSIPACDAALESAVLTADDRTSITSWRATAEKFGTDQQACRDGSVAACDTALASPVVDDTARQQLTEWRIAASPFNRLVAFLGNASEAVSDAASNLPKTVGELPRSTQVAGVLVVALAIALGFALLRGGAVNQPAIETTSASVSPSSHQSASLLRSRNADQDKVQHAGPALRATGIDQTQPIDEREGVQKSAMPAGPAKNSEFTAFPRFARSRILGSTLGISAIASATFLVWYATNVSSTSRDPEIEPRRESMAGRSSPAMKTHPTPTQHAGVRTSSEELSRAKAASILSVLRFPDETGSLNLTRIEPGPWKPDGVEAAIAKVERFVFGSDDDARGVFNESYGEFRGFLNGLQAVRLLAQQRIIKALEVERKSYLPYAIGVKWTPILADDVQQFCKQNDGRPYQEGNFGICSVIVGTRRFDAVTGITGEANHKVVEYRVLLEPNILGKKMGMQPKTEIRAAGFVKFDDGWRLQRQ